MKIKYLLGTLLVGIGIQASYAKPVTYTAEPTHSFVEYSINHFGYSNQTGKWFVESSTIVYDDAKISNSSVVATIEVNKMITGIPKLDEHLKNNEFFNTVLFPKAQFVSTKVVKTGKNTAKVMGNLTIKDQTHPITLKMTINQVAVSPITKQTIAGFSATTEIKRSDYDMGAYAPGLSDKVKLNIQIEAVQQ